MARRGDEHEVAEPERGSVPGPNDRPEQDIGRHRIGDAERQQAIDVLRAHTGAGRLTLDEFSDLVGDVYSAQTYAELEAVGRRLPPGLLPDPGAGRPTPTPPSPSGSPAPTGAPATTGPQRNARGRRKWFLGVMCGRRARGRWRPRPRLGGFAFWGGVCLDFRDAEIDGPIDVTAWALMGSVSVLVREGTRVEVDGMVLMGSASNRADRSEPDPHAPTIVVHARGLWGSVSVVARKTKAERIAAAAEAAGVDPKTIDLRTPGLLELPQRVLDDVAASIPGLLAGPPVWVRRHGHHRHDLAGWPPRPPAPPWADRRRGSRRTNGSVEANGTEPRDASPGPSGTLTMMVTDIVGSTRLAERLGDRRWITVLSEHNDLVRAAVADHGGTEVKAQGDGFLVVFPSARRAILAAIEVQRAVARSDEHPDAPLTLRIGLHTGEIVDMDGDVLGQNVIVAVRIAGSAEPGEIVVSGLTRDLTASGGDLTFGPAAEVELKGLSQPWRVHRVSWAPAPA